MESPTSPGAIANALVFAYLNSIDAMDVPPAPDYDRHDAGIDLIRAIADFFAEDDLGAHLQDVLVKMEG